MMTNINDFIATLALKRAVTGSTWNDIAEQVNSQFGTFLSADACRKRASNYRVSQSTSEILNEECDGIEDNTYDSDAEILTQMRDERNQVNALFKRMSRENSLRLLAKESVAEMIKHQPLTSTDKMYTSKSTNEALLLISDWHYGIDVDNYMNVYNPDICKQRVIALASEVKNKIKDNDINTLYVLNLGDMIAGLIHLPLRINSRLDVLTQAMQVSEIIADFLYDLSKCANIEYYQVLDNHSRINPNKKESIQLESLARITPWWLKERVNSIDIKNKYHNITINDNEIDQDIALFTINNDFSVVGVHGDKDKPITILKSLKSFVKEDIDLVCSAHLHHFSMNEDNRTVHISNGSLMGTDEFAFTKRLDSMPSQSFITFKDTEFGTDIDGIFKLNSYIFS